MLLVVVCRLGQLHQVIDRLLAIREALDLVPGEVLGHRKDAFDLLVQRPEIPIAPIAAKGVASQLNQRLLDPLHDERLKVFLEQHAVSIAVNDVALSIEDVIVFDHVLADIEVVRLDLLLRVFDGARYEGMFEWNIFFESELIHQPSD